MGKREEDGLQVGAFQEKGAWGRVAGSHPSLLQGEGHTQHPEAGE